MKEFRLSIDVTVRTGSGAEVSGLSPLVNDALTELTSRRDFRAGTIQPGRVLEHRIDFEDVIVTVDLTRVRIE